MIQLFGSGLGQAGSSTKPGPPFGAAADPARRSNTPALRKASAPEVGP